MNPFVTSNLRPLLTGRRVLLGITGSIAAFKACDIVRALRDAGAEVQVVLTDAATRFVTPMTLESLSGRRVHTSLWGDPGAREGAPGEARASQVTEVRASRPYVHIDLARWAEVFVVAPASADLIGKLANGIAGDLLTTEYLAYKGPVVIAPAMNPAMYSHPAVMRNVSLLRRDGVVFAGPVCGETNCGEIGEGRMAEPEEIVEAIAARFRRPLNGKRALVSLGPTRSALDPVRYLTNRSSGKMGAALCWAAAAAGYEVIAVRGPVDVALPRDARVIPVSTSDDMAKACLREWPNADVYFGAAAVLDFELEKPSDRKLKKESGPPALTLRKTKDILQAIGSSKRGGQKVIGFAAETDRVVEYARKKLAEKNCDAIFANDVSGSETGFESDRNAGWWITADEDIELAPADKAELAAALIELLEGRMPTRKVVELA